MKITVCIGSSCHIKGSREVVENLQHLIAKHNMTNEIELSGAFCMGRCQEGVNVMFEDKYYSVTPDNVDDFFSDVVLKK